MNDDILNEIADLPDIFPFNSLILDKKGLSYNKIEKYTIRSESAIILKPLLYGICNSDIKELQGVRQVRSDFGHELVGNVIWKTGNLPFRIGDLVCYNPQAQVERINGFCEYFISQGTTQQLEDAFITLPESISVEKLIFCEPLACTSHCIDRLLNESSLTDFENQDIAIIGAGLSGVMLAFQAKMLKGNITILNKDHKRIEFIKKNNLFDLNELSLLSDCHDKRYDSVIIATSFITDDMMSAGLRLVKADGTIVLFGGTNTEDKLLRTDINIDQIRRNELRAKINHSRKNIFIIGTYGTLKSDYLNVINMFEKLPETMPVEKLIGNIVTFNELKEYLSSLLYTPIYGKTIVIMGPTS